MVIETTLTNIHNHYVYLSMKEDHAHIPLKFHKDSLSILYMWHKICNNACKHVAMETTVIDVHSNKVLLEFKHTIFSSGNYVHIYQVA